ncbi:MAG: glycosyltransferase family 2 protein, partial [Clostridium sp.]
VPGANIFAMSDFLGTFLFGAVTGMQFIITPLILRLDKKISTGFFIMLAFYGASFIIIPLIVGSKNTELVFLANGVYSLAFLLGTYLFLGKKTVIFFFRFLLYGLYTLTWIPITIQGIINKNNKEWNPTKHVRSIEICDV